MQSEIAFLEQSLANRYARTSGQVAFIDETYRVNQYEDEENFYLVAGFLVDSESLVKRRQDFRKLLPSNYWHTTEAFAEGNQSQIRDFLRLVSSTDDVHVFAFTVAVTDNDAEHARRRCLAQLLKVFEAYEVRTAVIERRKTNSDRRSDEALFKKAIASGLISRKLEVLQGQPAAECLLWGADLVCWSLRRYLALNDGEWINLVSNKVFRIDLNTKSPLKTKKPEPAAAKGSGHEIAAVPRDTGRDRSSEKMLPPQSDIEQRVLRLFNCSLGVAIPSDELDDWLSKSFPRPRK